MMLYLFGTNFGYDMHDYPTMDIDDPTAKSFERAISYLPIFVEYLATEKLPERGMERVAEKMEIAGYSADVVEHFCKAWLETIEDKDLVCEHLMGIYLFGKYEFEMERYYDHGFAMICLQLFFPNYKEELQKEGEN